MDIDYKSTIASSAMMRLLPIFEGHYARKIAATLPDEYTNLQMSCLFLLKDIGAMAMNQISQHLLISKQYTTKIVDILAERGAVARTLRKEDRRTVYVDITDVGMKELNGYMDKGIVTFAKRLAGFDDSDKESLAVAADNLVRLLKKLGY